MSGIKPGFGFSLIEVLISTSILASTFLGLTAMQHKALLSTQSAFVDTRVLLALDDMLERIRSNNVITEYIIDFSDPAPPGAGDCQIQVCSPIQMANWDLFQWRALLGDQSYIPDAEGSISFDSAQSILEISIRYHTGTEQETSIKNSVRFVN